MEAEGGDLFYEWYHGDEILAEASGPELSIENFSSAKAGAYRVRISNSIGKLESLPALLQPGSPTNTFAAWAVASGLAGNKALTEADPDGDGFINLAEYLYGTSATSPNQKPSFQMGTVVVKGVEYSSASFMRRSRPGSGRLTYATAMTPTFDDAEPAEVYAVKSLPDGLELVVVRATQPLHNQQPQFFRFAVQK